ncbi:hypothetical protein D915_005825 [Fasciola hepatica]|uniref:Uncharacterized protein n=1 Tax=Fasciola hepatica TaxID=6192 RepID=A0A4E0RXM9_FASHE|nr:hypothetical protein D915_005825 [Fasciola hepatica]
MQTKSISPTCSSYPTTADHPSFYLPVSRETDSHQRCAVFFRFPDSSLSMANLNDPLRFRDHQTAVHFPIPNGCSTTALPSVLGQGAYEANHHFPCPTCPSHASEFHQRAGLTDQRHCDYDFQSTGSSSVTKPHAHSATDRCISVPSAVVRWGKSDCSVTVSSTDSQRFPNRSLLDTPLKAITDIHCIPTNECQQVDPVPCVSLKPTSKTSSEVTKTTGTFVASLSKGTIPPCVATSSSSNEMCNPNPTRFVTNDSNPIPVRPHELTSDCTEQKDPDTNTTPKDPLPHWNMRLTNIMHYPKYNTRRNSGFERRLNVRLYFALTQSNADITEKQIPIIIYEFTVLCGWMIMR